MKPSTHLLSTRIRPRWRASWWVLAAAIIFSSVLELTHDHYLAGKADLYDCAVCQHAVLLDTPPANSFTFIALPTKDAVITQPVNLYLRSPFFSGFQSRAPPQQVSL